MNMTRRRIGAKWLQTGSADQKKPLVMTTAFRQPRLLPLAFAGMKFTKRGNSVMACPVWADSL